MSLLQKNKIRRDIATDFYTKLRTAYVTAAVYIQSKCALNNPLLKFFCALDPQLCQSTLMHETLSNLKPYFELSYQVAVVNTHLKYKNMSLIQNYCNQKKKKD